MKCRLYLLPFSIRLARVRLQITRIFNELLPLLQTCFQLYEFLSIMNSWLSDENYSELPTSIFFFTNSMWPEFVCCLGAIPRILVTYSLRGRRYKNYVCFYEATPFRRRVEKSQVKHWNIWTLPGGSGGVWPLAYCTWGAREAGREVERTAPPRIEAPTPGTKFPSGPVEALQHPLYPLDAAGKSESTVTIVGSSREGARATRNVSIPGLSPPTHSAATSAKRDVTGGPFP